MILTLLANSNLLANFSSLASFFACVFLILYFVRPRLRIIDDSDYVNNKIRIKCINKNIFGLNIKDIKCDIVASKSKDFEIVETLELVKNWTAGLKYNKNYIFKVKSNSTDFSNKKHLKVRILTQNILGIKKLYERDFNIKN